jgi:hypothetical protein
MLVPMGFAREKAADMSVTMVQLASDMASFNNASPEETLDALRAGLAGESEPLRRFGVFLSDVTVKQEALNLGLYTGKGNLDAAGKAAATYSLILKQTKDAQGDFARTGDGLANQQRKLSALIRDTNASVGEALLPTVTKMTAALTGWLGKTENQQRIQDAANKTMRVAGDIVEAVWPKVQMVAKAADQVAQAVGGWDKALMLITGGVLLNKVNALAGAFGGKAGLASGAFRATSSLTGKGGLLSALNAIPVAIITTITVRKILQDLTGSDAAANVGGAAVGGSVAGATAARLAGQSALAGAKFGGAAGAAGAELVNPSDKLGAGTVPLWDGTKFAGVTAAGNAYWLGQRRAAGLGAPVVGQGPLFSASRALSPAERDRVVGPTALPAETDTSTIARKRFSYDAPQDYSGLSSASAGGGGGGGGSSAAKSAAKEAAAKAAQEALEGRLFVQSLRLFPGQAGPMSGFSADTIAADKAKAAETVRARIDAIARATSAARPALAGAFTKLGDSALKAFDAKTAEMQKGLASRLQGLLGEIEKARAELTPAERELQQLQEARQQQDLADALADAQASGDAKAIANAQYNIRVAALQKQAAAERFARDQDARTRADAAQQAYQDESTALADQRQIERDSYTDKLADLNEYLTERAKSVSTANERIRGDLGSFVTGLDGQLADVLNKLAALRAAQTGAPAPSAYSTMATLPTGAIIMRASVCWRRSFTKANAPNMLPNSRNIAVDCAPACRPIDPLVVAW